MALLLQGLTGCRQAPDLPDFDQEAWRGDSRSCNNVRPRLVPQLNKYTDQLVGLSHRQVIKILGKPEGKSMEKTGQRQYYYFIQAGPQCQDKTQFQQAGRLFIRFDILDRVNQITFQE